MALELKDVRAKLDPEAHRKLSAIAITHDRDMGDLIREAVDLYIAEEIRKAHVGKVLLRTLSIQGVDGEEQGTSST